MITQLIDKQDTFEIVRDQIAAILKLEIANQVSLATAAGKDASLWDMNVYSERSNPWEAFQEATTDAKPIVNVWFDNHESADSSSDTVERQSVTATYNIDCFTQGISADTADGHTPGDQASALNLHRVIRLVRNILMASTNTYLQLRGTVWRRTVGAVNVFQPSADDTTIQNIMGARLIFRVTFNEFSPQYEYVELETLSVQVKRKETGEILLATEYIYDGP